MTPCCPHCGSIATKSVTPKTRECSRCGHKGKSSDFQVRPFELDLSDRDILASGSYRKRAMFSEE